VRILPLGEAALTVELGDVVDPAVNDRVHLLAEAVRRELRAIVQEVAPTYRSLTLFYDPLRVTRAEVEERLTARVGATSTATAAATATARTVTIPVVYGGEHGPDLGFVAEHAGLAPEAVVALHAGATYRVYMLGFTPGFPYLGGLPERLATPRLPQPRALVPAGSVGIAGAQTGVYPVASPGGWRLIGRTPLRLFDPAARAPFLLRAGDRLRFQAVPASQWPAGSP
jgi:inhibitor of KinA